MRKIVILLCSLAATLVPAAASAQTLDRVLGLLGGATAYGYNSCSYVSGGLQSASCQANRALNVVSTLRQSEQNARYRQQERFNRRTQQLTALQRACQAGDTESCARSGGTDGKQMEVARALMDACTSGDKRSCSRAESMMDERNIDRQASYGQQRYAQPARYAEPARYARNDYQPHTYQQRSYQPAQSTQSCRPAIDARTGYRIPGQLDCR